MDKKGLEMAITTVIMIILSITVLTILIVFFNSQTGFLNKWFKGQQTQSNVDEIISNCNSLVTRQANYAYCCEQKEVQFGNDQPKQTVTCDGARTAEWSSNRIDELSCAATSCLV